MNKIALIMCTWKRINFLQRTIDLLSTQLNKDFDFYIWNNNQSIIEQLNTIIKPYNWIKVKHSESNIGGIGRFYYAKEICNEYEKIAFIDDDQIFDNTLIQCFHNEYEPKTVKSWFAWKFKSNNYWDRFRITTGEEANYCGTGGQIIDASVFNDSELLKTIPEKYKFIEDVWLSYYCNHKKNWKLKSTKTVKIQIQEDGHDQFVKLKELKTEFLRYLIKQGWKL
jgi:hypothetical protein